MSYLTEKKFAEVVAIIYAHYDDYLDLKTLAKKAGLSLASLKRLFEKAVDMSPGAFIRRIKMEQAFCQLQKEDLPITDIALDANYENAAAFSREFKARFSMTPSEAKKQKNFIGELEQIKLTKPVFIAFKGIDVYGITEKGPYFTSAFKAWDRLKSVLSQTEFSNDPTEFFIGFGHDDPHLANVSVDKVRFSACITGKEHIAIGEEWHLKKGQYAKFYFYGKPNHLNLAYHHIYGSWQQGQAKKIDNHKWTFCMYENFPQVFKDQKIIIMVPLE